MMSVTVNNKLDDEIQENTGQNIADSRNEIYYNEQYRPQYHFSPEVNWMNDPNGLVYYKGEYHLFYQYHPYDAKWGPMHWGHAVSKDLVHWEHLPIALYPDENGQIFSGSVIVDENNTSGFQVGSEKALVAVFTHHSNTGCQVQSIAYSNDKGRTWTKYEGNPVITHSGYKDFRDPKVFWHTPTGRWVMVVAAGDRVLFYTSYNLKHWEYASEFGSFEKMPKGVWECPDIFELPLDGHYAQKKWVLTISIGDGAVNGGSGMLYFIGSFDGNTFTSEYSCDSVKWVDYGRDFYAAVSWNNIPNNHRRIWIGWMNNWKYAQDVPTTLWRSMMSIPRELHLVRKENENIQLIQRPVDELKSLRGEKYSWSDKNILPNHNILSDIMLDTFEIIAEFDMTDTAATEFGFKVRKGKDSYTLISYIRHSAQLEVDRTLSGNSGFNEGFSGRHAAPMMPENNRIKMHIFVDRCSVEVFGNDGEVVISEQIFPDDEAKGLDLFCTDGNVALVSLEIFAMNRIWESI